ncbi:ABC transporter ATP-binding protein [Ureibacillus acetophenoni]|uniref:Peptide/nickel transport system ATP-binding protein/oligopeptide transport system ATP-binding protein n=1 Tax=Ureibacillus acetophenoni TaxID=614649 RepID=A0A285UG49_9BACL|nr:dipeptide ABC transporter ATP-binding protein [Ureibacillus acetophenoni]SOC40904.1 peptide/nickel transport system ATP-binding protein/oligopeptide transport system ATP-binding protein [Ureibacillus acetophenoni]
MSTSTMKSVGQPLLEVRNLKKHYAVRNSLGKTTGYVRAINDISFTIYEGETYGLVGESGCGKSTTGRTLLRLVEPTSGEAQFNGNNIFDLNRKELRGIRKDLQMIFQDPHTSLDPKRKVGYSIEESLIINGVKSKEERKRLVTEMLVKLGFNENDYNRFPHEFSGGQRQRIGIARSLILNPKLIICDEPVSALDVSIQAQIINLLKDLQKQLTLSYLFISHDLSVVRHIADRIGVMYLGNLVEQGTTEEIFSNPLHPYTKGLLSAVPVINESSEREKIEITGEIPSPINPPSGCVFRTRCPFAFERCSQESPAEIHVGEHRSVKCHLYDHK